MKLEDFDVPIPDAFYVGPDVSQELRDVLAMFHPVHESPWLSNRIIASGFKAVEVSRIYTGDMTPCDGFHFVESMAKLEAFVASLEELRKARQSDG